jgi:hypothetical protein
MLIILDFGLREVPGLEGKEQQEHIRISLEFEPIMNKFAHLCQQDLMKRWVHLGSFVSYGQLGDS